MNVTRAACWAIWGVASASSSNAAAASAPASYNSRSLESLASVRLLLSRDPADEGDMRAAAARLGELDVRVTLARDTSRSLGQAVTAARLAVQATPVTAVLWLGTWQTQRALFVYSSSAQRPFVRLLDRGSNLAAEREELAIVVRASVKALLEGSPPALEPLVEPTMVPSAAVPSSPSDAPSAGSASAERKASPSEPVESAVERARYALGLQAGYFGSTAPIDADSDWQSGVSVGLRVGLPRGWFADASYAILPRASATLGDVSVSFVRHPLLLAFGHALTLDAATNLALTGALTLSADRIVRTTGTTGELLEPTEPEGRWLVGGGARLGAAVDVTTSFCLYTELGVEFTPQSYAYAVQDTLAVERLGVRSLSARLALGARFELLGARASAPRESVARDAP